MSNKSFNSVGGLRPSLNLFNLSHSIKYDCDMGQLIPVMCDEVIPGDIFKISNQMVVRMTPLVAPIMDTIRVKVRYFFVPYRLLTDGKLQDGTQYKFDWENFLSQGSDGLDATEVLPRWYPTKNGKGSLWDYFAFPVGVQPAGAYPLDFPRQAYNFIYNEFFRFESIQDEIDIFNEDILHVNWEKDYFTSALLEQQRGIAPVLSGSILYLGDDDQYHSVRMCDVYKSNLAYNWDFVDDNDGGTFDYVSNNDNTISKGSLASGRNNFLSGDRPSNVYPDSNAYVSDSFGSKFPLSVIVTGATKPDFTIASPKGNQTPIVYGGFNVAQLRLTIQAQKWLERSNRAGNRYTELLRSHFGVFPRDERLDRPEYIGGSSTPIIISEVLQTSSSDSTSPQGNMSGHGITIDRGFVAKYRVKEFGLIMGLAYIVPRPTYGSQGINRQWLRRDRFDFYFPEFAHLSEQGIETAEIYATNDESTNKAIFGYIGHQDEMRHKQDKIAGSFRDTLSYWTLSREFASRPLLNDSFVKCVPSKDIFAVQNEPAFLVNFENVIHAWRPMPVIAEPGLVDHY